MNPADYERIEAEITSDSSPVGIDAKKTHVMILAKLESIERRLDALESNGGDGIPATWQTRAEHGVATATDTFDDTVATLAARGVDVDARVRALAALVETATAPGTLDALATMLERLEALAPLTELAAAAPHALATGVDAFDAEVAQLREHGVDVDQVLRNGLHALLFLGQRISTAELDALGTLLRSDVLHPQAIDIVGRLGRALVAAANEPTGSVGPIGAVSKLGRPQARHATAFALELAKHFGATLEDRRTDDRARAEGGH